MEDKQLATVILLGETGGDEEIFAAVKNVYEQTHKNVDLIVSVFRDKVEDELKDKCSSFFLNIRWLTQNPDVNFIKDLIELSDGRVIFYKTVNNVLWFPRHIEVHLDEFNKDKSIKWCLSHVENRNIALADSPYNTVSFRIDNPPKPDSISIDEICHIKDLETDWSTCLIKENGAPMFFAGLVTKQWIEAKSRGSIPPEITLVHWVEIGNNQQESSSEDAAKQLGVPAITEIKEDMKESDGDFEVVRIFPTVVGNTNHDEYNNNIRNVISQTDNITSIAIKRTIGMGDVVVVEPIIKKLRQKYPNATIDLHTASPDIVKYFKSKPDNTITTESGKLLEDLLSTTDAQLKYDLDLSYESRTDVSFIDAYAEVIGLEFEDNKDKHVELECKTEAIHKTKYAVVCGDGSGWPGKTWGAEKYKEVIQHIQSLGYEVIETGADHTDITPTQYHTCEFDTMVNLIAHCDFYVGADNGPMHVARGFGKPCVLIAGAARPYYTNPNRDNVVYVEDHTSKGLGIKHKQFFNMTQSGLTFMPVYEEESTCGLMNIQPVFVKRAVDKLLAKPVSQQGNVMDYQFNTPGNLVVRDVMPGFAYYKDNVTNITWREDRHYHPDQRIDVSQLYDAEKESVWRNNFKPVADYIEINNLQDRNILDVGCNMGIFVEHIAAKGADVVGIDLNKLSITRGKNTFNNVEDKLILGNYLTHKFDKKFGILLCSDVINIVSSPIDFLGKCNNDLEDGGYMFINFYNFDNSNWRDQNRKWVNIGVGDRVTFFDDDTFKVMLTEAGFTIVDEYCEGDTNDMKFYTCKKVG